MLNKVRDLRDGRSLWQDSARSGTRHRTKLPAETCDVAVIGAGVSGALIALHLADAGHDVVVVDRREPISGSTSASTALIQFEIDTPFIELSEKIGAARAARAYRRSYAAVMDLAQLVQRRRLRVQWHKRRALYLAGSRLGSRALRREAELRAKIGLPSAFIDGGEVYRVYGIDRTGAIISDGSGELNPVQLAASCFASVQRKGGRIYAPFEVTDVVANARGVDILTKGGGHIAARKAIFATGYEVVKGVPKSAFDITSSWAIATKPVSVEKFWPGRCLIWEAADPYLYLRTTADNRVVIGGEDSSLKSPARRSDAIPAKSEKLLERLNGLLPGRQFEIDYSWAGTFAESDTGLPYIAPISGMKNCFATLGCGGNGITFSMVAAQLALAWVDGKKDPDASLFRGSQSEK